MPAPTPSFSVLADRFGTPLYVHDAATLRARAARLRSTFGPQVDVLYAVKANPSLAVATVLRRCGLGADVASGGELALARAAGFDADAIRFAGPGKTDAELIAALDVGIACVHVEAADEVERLTTIARARGVRPSVAIRVNPPAASSGRMQMGGGAKKFGVDADAVPALARRIVDDGVCALVGLQVYAGTQLFDAAAWLRQAVDLVALADLVEDEIGRELNVLNFGGGFGVAMNDDDETFDVDAAAAGVRDLLSARPQRRGAIEVGRWLVADAGTYLARVVSTKTSGGRRFAILDGGLHHHAAATGFGGVVRRMPPMHVVGVAADAPPEPITICGPLCAAGDEFAADVALPPVAPGALLAFDRAGAYGLTFSPVLLAGHPLPAEVLVDGADAWLARERGAFDDVLRGQQAPAVDEGALLDRVARLVGRVILQRTGRSVAPLPDDDLSRYGLSDAIGLLDLALALQFDLGVAVEPHESDARHLGSVRRIAELVERRIGRG